MSQEGRYYQQLYHHLEAQGTFIGGTSMARNGLGSRKTKLVSECHPELKGKTSEEKKARRAKKAKKRPTIF